MNGKISDGNKWNDSFTDLPEYKAGKKIAYTVSEKEVKGYKAVISGNAEEGFVVTNSHTPKEANTTNTDKQSPKTGDDTNMFLWTVLLLVSAFGFCGSLAYKKEKMPADKTA